MTVADVDWAAVRAGVHDRAAEPADLAGCPRRGRRSRRPPPAAARRAAGRGLLAGRLAGLPAAEQEQVLLELVRAEAAAVLGHPSPDAVDAGPRCSVTWGSTR